MTNVILYDVMLHCVRVVPDEMKGGIYIFKGVCHSYSAVSNIKMSSREMNSEKEKL